MTRPIAEIAFDRSDSDDKMWARLYAPEQQSLPGSWSCTFKVDPPIGISRTIHGVSSLQSMALALKILSAYLYGSEAYENKEFGRHGEFGGDLSMPAPAEFLAVAPYPF